jgi:hypothetical protein
MPGVRSGAIDNQQLRDRCLVAGAIARRRREGVRAFAIDRESSDAEAISGLAGSGLSTVANTASSSMRRIEPTPVPSSSAVARRRPRRQRSTASRFDDLETRKMVVVHDTNGAAWPGETGAACSRWPNSQSVAALRSTGTLTANRPVRESAMADRRSAAMSQSGRPRSDRRSGKTGDRCRRLIRKQRCGHTGAAGA